MPSGDHPSDDDTSSASDASSGGSGQDGRALIDDEAEESDGTDSSDVSDSLDCAREYSFPQFMQLPPELRHRIWEVFCPDLTAKARVFQFFLSPSSAAMGRPDHYSVKDHLTLGDQTEKLRAVLSTHRESRSIAVQKLPHELGMDAGSGDAIVRFRKETDVIILHGLKAGKDLHLPEFARDVQNIAVNPWELFFGGMLNGPVDEAIPALAGIFRNLKRLYVHTPAESQRACQIRWCVTDYVHTYMVETYEKQDGRGEDLQSLFCWPDVDGHPDFAKYSIPKLFSRGKDVEVGVEMWPMVEFELDEGIAQYDRLRVLKDLPDLGDGELSGEDGSVDDDDEFYGGSPQGTYWDEHDSETFLDEYESEGIDDDEIVEVGDTSEDDMIPDEIAAHFSSPEPEDYQSKDVLIIDRPDRGPLQTRLKRRLIMDSDDSGEDAQPQTKRARQTRTIVVSDSDEDDVEVIAARQRSKSRPKVSESDEDEEGEENTQVNGVESRDSPQDDEDESDDKNVPPRRLSLAERLRRARNENPVPASQDDTDEGDNDTEDEEEAEGDDDDVDEEDEDEDGLLDTMAGDGTDEDEGEEDGW
ncbi:hypothetical protein QQS21_000837 [Conoideocrella luteorostrata]|uniref:2EXR domain-containing protein n=1 Tax=Conoideocrella luteorostrata TaxID=1105319 RepID=A0AAJ0FYV6_9HYPO|nr:hypothetical protein QQS21_000837 [Conoideocrella luteorostrata]